MPLYLSEEYYELRLFRKHPRPGIGRASAGAGAGLGGGLCLQHGTAGQRRHLWPDKLPRNSADPVFSAGPPAAESVAHLRTDGRGPEEDGIPTVHRLPHAGQ